MERSKQNKHVVCDKDNDVDNGGDDGVDDGVGNDSVDDVDGADKHFTYLSQADDCCLTEGSKQNKHVVCDKDNDVGN
eukprot:4335150-Ditylum_brightwellii.AAC.1